ncbi:DUF6113 family protein [Streptomyces sp. NPDC050560]|uniref:DUF6113 family protein n=1 Tax=Streptomyces sp. NPDC050560 TaxID=3365630 RepID=UPI00378B1181
MSATKRARANASPRGSAGASTPGGTPPRGTAPRPGPGRVAVHVLLLLLGAVAAVAGALLQGAWFPGGLLLSLAAAAGLFVGGAVLTGGRGGTLAAEAGWIITMLLLTAPRSEGDFLFAAGAGGYLFLFGSLAVAALCATLWQPVRPRPGGGTAT